MSAPVGVRTRGWRWRRRTRALWVRRCHRDGGRRVEEGVGSKIKDEGEVGPGPVGWPLILRKRKRERKVMSPDPFGPLIFVRSWRHPCPSHSVPGRAPQFLLATPTHPIRAGEPERKGWWEKTCGCPQGSRRLAEGFIHSTTDFSFLFEVIESKVTGLRGKGFTQDKRLVSRPKVPWPSLSGIFSAQVRRLWTTLAWKENPLNEKPRPRLDLKTVLSNRRRPTTTPVPFILDVRTPENNNFPRDCERDLWIFLVGSLAYTERKRHGFGQD